MSIKQVFVGLFFKFLKELNLDVEVHVLSWMKCFRRHLTYFWSTAT